MTARQPRTDRVQHFFEIAARSTSQPGERINALGLAHQELERCGLSFTDLTIGGASQTIAYWRALALEWEEKTTQLARQLRMAEQDRDRAERQLAARKHPVALLSAEELAVFQPLAESGVSPHRISSLLTRRFGRKITTAMVRDECARIGIVIRG